MSKFSFSESSIGLCKVNKAVTNDQYLIVNGDKAFFSRLAYYFNCRLLGLCIVYSSFKSGDNSILTPTNCLHHKLPFHKLLVHHRVF